MSKRKSGKLFESLPVYAVPKDTLWDESRTLRLQGAALSLWLLCCREANKQKSDGVFILSRAEAAQRTGYSEVRMRQALKTLQDKKLIVLIDQKKFFDSGRQFNRNLYSIASGGYPLGRVYENNDGLTLRELLFKKGLGYDDLPTYLFDTLADLRGGPLAAALAAIKQAVDNDTAALDFSMSEWRRMSGIRRNEILREAWTPELIKMLRINHRNGSSTAHVEFFSPHQPWRTLANNKADAVERQEEREAKSAWEAEQGRTYDQKELERWFLSEFPEAKRDGDELCVDCPYCHGTKGGHVAPTPTLRADFGKGSVGVINCTAFLRSRDDDARCDFADRWQQERRKCVPFHLVAFIKSITPAAAQKRMRTFILTLRDRNKETQ